MQCLWNYRHRPKWHQVLFNLGSMAITWSPREVPIIRVC